MGKMIGRQYDYYYAVCDICNEVIGPCGSWDDAKEQMKEEGWRFLWNDRKEWQHFCPICKNIK